MKNEIVLGGEAVPRLLEKEIKLLADKILSESGIRQRSLDIVFLKNGAMRRLKSRFLPGRKGPASTLSFAENGKFCHPEVKYPYLGEIYINLELTGGRITSIKPLLIHSMLHIMGYEHGKGRDIIKMERRERELSELIK